VTYDKLDSILTGLTWQLNVHHINTNKSKSQSPLLLDWVKSKNENSILNEPLAFQRTQHEIRSSRCLQESQEYLSWVLVYNVDTNTWIPKTYQDVMRRPNLWWKPIAKEIEMLKQRDVFILVPRLVGQSVVGSKWVFALK